MEIDLVLVPEHFSIPLEKHHLVVRILSVWKIKIVILRSQRLHQTGAMLDQQWRKVMIQNLSFSALCSNCFIWLRNMIRTFNLIYIRKNSTSSLKKRQCRYPRIEFKRSIILNVLNVTSTSIVTGYAFSMVLINPN